MKVQLIESERPTTFYKCFLQVRLAKMGRIEALAKLNTGMSASGCATVGVSIHRGLPTQLAGQSISEQQLKANKFPTH